MIVPYTATSTVHPLVSVSRSKTFDISVYAHALSDYVNNNPAAFADAYFDFAWIKHYS